MSKLLLAIGYSAFNRVIFFWGKSRTETSGVFQQYRPSVKHQFYAFGRITRIASL